MLGLRNLKDEIKGCGLRLKFYIIRSELKKAWQRAWNGYDYSEVWNINSKFFERYAAILEEYKNKHYGLWWCPDGYDWSKVCEKASPTDLYVFSDEQMDAIIDTIIFHLKMSDEDYVEKQLYGSNVYDKNYTYSMRTIDDYKRIASVRKQNQDRAMDLLKLFMDELWD